ncbi:hypothetical protein NQ315_013965 [Exocentrus adspersus]|uniref:Uncharacterized protein n=1 Tax=Exocentrus adspersus TaxID=1586481 RepID=A0AAV8VS98_9CUCU|nr:hypothetical protein NQ315_013965 [Exocentrus adspersus]
MAQEDLEKFDIRIVYEKFGAAVQEEDDVHLQFYLESFEELNKRKGLGKSLTFPDDCEVAVQAIGQEKAIQLKTLCAVEYWCLDWCEA